MPDIEWNLKIWDRAYSWPDQGEEWSKGWGSSQAQFFGSIFPRIARWLPAPTILEIAPGFGRWTKFLLNFSQTYYGVDLSQKCVEVCAQKFGGESGRHFITNDGFNLNGVPDGSIDFVFSYDSLVHVESDVMDAYITQLVRKLKPEGVGFIHHSNAKGATNEMLEAAKGHKRALSVNADSVKELLQVNGGFALIQEEIDWGSPHRIDCHTVFCKQSASFATAPLFLQNNNFMREAASIRETQALYWPPPLTI